MSTPTPMDPARRLLDESGMTSSHEPIDTAMVRVFLDKHFELGGRLENLATEKDDSFRLRTDARDYLVKVSPPAEPEAVVALQTAAMRFLENAAPELPVQRVMLSVDGDDHVVITTQDRGTRVLRVFNFVEGAVLARTSADAAQLAKVGEVLGRIDVALERFDHAEARRGLIWDIQHFHQLTGLLEHTANTEHRQLAREVFGLFHRTVVPRMNDLETQVIHGDYSPHNVVVDPRSEDFVLGVIDFGDTVHSALVFDPAVPLANLLGRTPDDPWRDPCAFMAGYASVRPLDAAELPVLAVAAVARLTLRALITNWRAELVPQRREYLLDHAKDDWLNVDRALGAPLDEVCARFSDARQQGG